MTANPLLHDLGMNSIVSMAIFFGLFIVALIGQVSSESYHPIVCRAAILTTTTAGTTRSDCLDRTARPRLHQCAMGIDRGTRRDPGAVEGFHWTVTILFSNTLGTALGDSVADTSGPDYEGGTLVFGAGLTLIALTAQRIPARDSA